MKPADVPDANDPMRGDRHCLVFLHIPKTAGMAIAPNLRWNFRPDETIHLKTVDEHRAPGATADGALRTSSRSPNAKEGRSSSERLDTTRKSIVSSSSSQAQTSR
jgi:hypothetical protein